jgi:hypothetical protein
VTAPSTSARQAAVDAANGVTTISRPHLEAILNRFAETLAGDLFIARREDGVDCVWRPNAAFPNSPQCLASRAGVEDEVWALLEAILPTRDEEKAPRPEPTFEERFPDWDRTNGMVAGRYFDAEIAPTYGPDVSVEELEELRTNYVARTATSLDAMPPLQEWDARRRGEA